MTRLLGWLTGFTPKFWLAVCAALALFAGVQTLRLSWAHTEIAKAERDKARTVAEAVAQARKADAVGVGAADAVQGAVEAGNDRARDAARGSDDPLRDGLEALR